jgi:hypothetical protein
VQIENARHTCSLGFNWQQFAFHFMTTRFFVFELTLIGSISLQLPMGRIGNRDAMVKLCRSSGQGKGVNPRR